MADDIALDTSELRTLAVDLTRAGALPMEDVRGVVQHGALNIKTQMRAEMAASKHFRGITSSITYDTAITATGVTAEIGPDKDYHGGALANVAYFGTSRGGGTVPDPQRALDAEAPNVERYLADLVDKVLP